MTFLTPYTQFFFDLPNLITVFAISDLFLIVGIPLLAFVFLITRVTYGYQPGMKLKTAMTTLWVASILGLFAMATFAAKEFSAETEISQSFEVPLHDTLSLQLESVNRRSENFVFEDLTFGENEIYCKSIDLRIEKSEDNQFYLKQTISSRGANSQKANQLAEEIQYPVTINDKSITLSREFIIPEGSKYRGQVVELTLKVPEGKVIHLADGMRGYFEKIDLTDRHVTPWGNPNKHWLMEDEGLSCNTCDDRNENISLDHSGFNKIQVDGKVKLKVVYGEKFKIDLSNRKKNEDKIEVIKLGDVLTISSSLRDHRSIAKLTIEMPYLESIDSKNIDDLKVIGFTQPSMIIKNKGRADIKAIVNVDSLTVRQGGRSEFQLSGKGTWLSAKIEEHGKLNADRYTVNVANVRASQYSFAELMVSDTIHLETEDGSRIKYEGDPVVAADIKGHEFHHPEH